MHWETNMYSGHPPSKIKPSVRRRQSQIAIFSKKVDRQEEVQRNTATQAITHSLSIHTDNSRKSFKYWILIYNFDIYFI